MPLDGDRGLERRQRTIGDGEELVGSCLDDDASALLRCRALDASYLGEQFAVALTESIQDRCRPFDVAPLPENTAPRPDRAADLVSGWAMGVSISRPPRCESESATLTPLGPTSESGPDLVFYVRSVLSRIVSY
jgi:hypothetical protein